MLFAVTPFLWLKFSILSKESQEKQVLELKCYFFKHPIKILPEALSINFKDAITKKITDEKQALEIFKKTCILEMVGFTYFVCVLPYEYESEEVLEEDFRLLSAKGELSVKHALINNKHSYEAIKLRPIKQELVPSLCLFFQGSLEFNDKTTKTMRTSLLNQIQQDDKSYLRIWEKYLIINAQKSFNETREVGLLEIVDKKAKGSDLEIRFKQALDKNKKEILDKKTTLAKGIDLGVLEGLDTQNEESLINFISEKNKTKDKQSKNNKEAEKIEIKKSIGDYWIIDYNPSI
ncbi:hypothetical protein ckin119_00080 [Helicobacter pylori]